MRSMRMTRVRAVTVALLAALLPVGLTASYAGAAETEGEKNLTEPVLFAEPEGADDFIIPDDTTLTGVVGTPTYLKDGISYYVVTDPDVTFAAPHVVVAAPPVAVTADWGDNLTNHSFRGSTKQPIRVEMALWATGQSMPGYEPVLLEGAMGSEVYGITGVVTDRMPLVYTVGEQLTIERLNADGSADVIYGPGPMTAEINAAGKLIFGFSWGTPSGLTNPDPGTYRLTFSVPDSVQITGVGAADLFLPTFDDDSTQLEIVIGQGSSHRPPDKGPGGDTGGGGGAGSGFGGGRR